MSTSTFSITKTMLAACKAYGKSVGSVASRLEDLRVQFGPKMLERWTTLTTQAPKLLPKAASDQVCREVRQALAEQFGSAQSPDTQAFMDQQKTLVDKIMTAERVANSTLDLKIKVTEENGNVRSIPVGEALSVGALKRFSKDFADEEKREAIAEAIGERMSDPEKRVEDRLSESQATSLKGKIDSENDPRKANERIHAALLIVEGILVRQHGSKPETRMTKAQHDKEVKFALAIFEANSFEISDGREPFGKR